MAPLSMSNEMTHVQGSFSVVIVDGYAGAGRYDTGEAPSSSTWTTC